MKHQHRVPYRHLEISTGTSECFWFGSAFVLSILAVVSHSWLPSSSLSSFSLSSLCYICSFSSCLVVWLDIFSVLQRGKTVVRLSQRVDLLFLIVLCFIRR